MVDSIRCIKVSPDGKELASGDEVGNIRINSLESETLAQKRFLESHDSEVISLAYSEAVPTSGRGDPTKTRHLLASGGRDK
jgi:WD40 repeat protein